MSRDSEYPAEPGGEDDSSGNATKTNDHEFYIPKIKNTRPRQQRWGVEDEMLLIEWMGKDGNYSRCRLDNWLPDGRRKLGAMQTFSEEAVVFLRSEGIIRTADQVMHKIAHLVKTWQEADRLMQEFNAVHSSIFSPEIELQDVMEDGTRENILRVCRHWDLLDPILQPVYEKAKRAPLIPDASAAIIAENDRAAAAEVAERRDMECLDMAYACGTPIAPKVNLGRLTVTQLVRPDGGPVQQVLLIPRPTSTELKCAVCGSLTDGPCVLHTRGIHDGEFRPRAYATLPADFTISNFDRDRVMSTVDILEPTVFGPLVGTLVDYKEDLQSDLSYVLSVPEDNAVVTKFFCLKSDDSSSWLKFVRLVQQASEANLMVFQQQGGIYFSSFKPVHAGEELVAVYSAQYAKIVEEATRKSLAASVRCSSAFYTAFPHKCAAQSPPPKKTPTTSTFLAKTSALPNFLPGDEEIEASVLTGFLSTPLAARNGASNGTPERRPVQVKNEALTSKEKPVLRRSTRNSDKTKTSSAAIVLSGTEDHHVSLLESNYEDVYDSGSDWAPEQEKTKSRESSEERSDVELPRPLLEKVPGRKPNRKQTTKSLEEVALRNVERAAANGHFLDYQKELDKLGRRRINNQERYRALKYGELVPLPVTLDMLENDPKDRMRTVQEIMSIEHLVKQLDEAVHDEKDKSLLTVAKECLERERARSTGIKRRRFTRRSDLGGKSKKMEHEGETEAGTDSEVEEPKKKEKKKKMSIEPKKPKVKKAFLPGTSTIDRTRERAKQRTGKFSQSYRFATFACDECEAGFRLQALLDLHSITHGKTLDSPPSLTCPSCDLVSESMDELLNHVKKHQRRWPLKLTKVTDFQCEICKQCYNTESFLKRHMSRVHPPGGKKPVTYDEPKFPCAQCDKMFLTAPALGSHERLHKGRFAECIICLEHLKNSVDLYQHVTEKHQVNGVFHCRLCERTYPEYNFLKQHVKTYHRPRNICCDKCPKMFKNKKHLTIHYVCHQNEFPFLCDTCGRKFKRKKNYDGHMARLHKADRNYRMKERSEKIASAFSNAVVCEYCTRQYQNGKRLLIHQREKHLELLPHKLRVGDADDEGDSRSLSEGSEEF